MALFHMDIPSNHILNVFGNNDMFIKKIERSFDVTVVNRDGVNISGGDSNVRRASAVLNRLYEQSLKGNEIEESGVDYAIAMSMEEQVDALSSMDDTIICHTINGKPIRPKTL
ncbi:MAG: phosphate starvation-inducible protein PhoH, partial [Lachnospiraceae bacterium]|nr:phosphate starvation-inducible protein PhoH [Lachnospiraceae bacterium]